MTTSIKKFIVFFFKRQQNYSKKLFKRDYSKKAGCVLDPQIKTVAEKKSCRSEEKKEKLKIAHEDYKLLQLTSNQIALD